MTTNISGKKWDLPILLLGIISAINFQVGVLFIPIELLAVSYLLLSFNRSSSIEHHGLRRFLKWLLLSGFILILVQIFTDLFLRTAIIETAKSTASILTLVALIFTGITWVAQDDLRLKSFLLGYVLSSLLTYFAFNNDYVKADSWKFLFANISTVLILTALGFVKKSRVLKITVIILLSSIHLAFGARSAALLTLLTVVALILPSSFVSNRRGLAIIFFSVFLLSMFTEQLYQQLSIGGKLGLSQQEKALQQFQSGPLLLFARSELLYEVGAIRENPLIGKGSNPILSQSLLINISQDQERFGLQVKETAAYGSYLKTGRIPLHSMLFSSWVEAGIAGMVFWLFVLYFFLRYFRVVVASKSSFSLLATYLLFSALWSLFFSPLGAGSRLFIALGVTCVARVIFTEGGFDRKHEYFVGGNPFKKSR